MKHTHILATALLALVGLAAPMPVMADDAPATTLKSRKGKKKSKKKAAAKEKEAQPAELSTIAKLLEGAEYLTDSRPNLQAKYYIFLYSASWCGPCRMEMPKIAAEYPNIRESGQVELILASADNDPTAALNFVTSNNGTFPVIPKGKMPQLPNTPQMRGIPTAVFVDADGNILATRHGSDVISWRNFTIDNPEAKSGEEGSEIDPDMARDMQEHAKKVAREAAKKAAAESFKTVPKAIEALEFFNGTPNTKAKYYIYLHSASWCGPCKQIMPKLIEEYEAMKKGKVEIILVGHDQTPEAAEEYIRHYSEEIAGIHYKDPGAQKLPGFTKPNGIPHTTIVDRKGKVLYAGHASGALNWKDHCGKKKKKK